MKKLFAIIALFLAAAFWLLGQEEEPLPFTISYYAVSEQCFNTMLPQLLDPSSEITLRATNKEGAVYAGYWRTGKVFTNGWVIVGLAGQPITHVVLSTPREQLGQISLELSNKVYGNEVFLPYMLFWAQHAQPLGTNGTEYTR